MIQCLQTSEFSSLHKSIPQTSDYKLAALYINHRAANHYDFCGIVIIFCSSLCTYSENYNKSALSCNSSIWCSSVTVLATHCITQLACLYFGEYPQAVACSAQPQWLLSHGNCSRPHGLKTFTAPAFSQ